jgi:hypothetical protein
LAQYGAELTIGTARRLLGDLIRKSGLTLEAAGALKLEDAIGKLDAVSSPGTETNAPEKRSETGPAGGPTDAVVAAKTGDDASIALLRVFTNGLVDDRINEAAQVLTNDELTASEKLTKIDALIRFPPTASAEQLGKLLGVTKQAILKTDWWMQNRKGEKANEIGRRRAGHQKRAKDYEPPDTKEDR